MNKYEWEVLMESGIIHKVLATSCYSAGSLAESWADDDYKQAYRKVGTTEWIAY